MIISDMYEDNYLNILFFLQEAQDRTDIIAFDDDDDWEKLEVGNEGKTGMNMKVNKVNDNSDPSSDVYVEEQSSDFISEFFDFFG